jgi:hypothetical protein
MTDIICKEFDSKNLIVYGKKEKYDHLLKGMKGVWNDTKGGWLVPKENKSRMKKLLNALKKISKLEKLKERKKSTRIQAPPDNKKGLGKTQKYYKKFARYNFNRENSDSENFESSAADSYSSEDGYPEPSPLKDSRYEFLEEKISILESRLNDLEKEVKMKRKKKRNRVLQTRY